MAAGLRLEATLRGSARCLRHPRICIVINPPFDTNEWMRHQISHQGGVPDLATSFKGIVRIEGRITDEALVHYNSHRPPVNLGMSVGVDLNQTIIAQHKATFSNLYARPLFHSRLSRALLAQYNRGYPQWRKSTFACKSVLFCLMHLFQICNFTFRCFFFLLEDPDVAFLYPVFNFFRVLES